MKRSEINTILQNAKAFLAASQFHLPPFAAWSPADWQSRGSEASEIVERDLGWDITDFGSGDFDRCGLFLFTLRNGHRTALQTGKGKVYLSPANAIVIGKAQALMRAGNRYNKHFRMVL